MATTDTDRKRASTYVPEEQKEEWKQHAEELNMTQSEFIRAMVQAGRRDFTINTDASSSEEQTLAETIVGVLGEHESLAWDELLQEITASVEDELEETLDELQQENTVRYSGRNGGYSLQENE